MGPPPIRVVLGLMAFFTTTNVYLARVNLNIAITAMVIEKQSPGNDSSVVCEREYELGTSPSEFNSSLSGETSQSSADTSVVENAGRDTFDWTNRQSGLMLGGYFYGYAAMMPFGGYISAYVGVRRTMTLVMLISSLLSFGYIYIITIPNFGFHLGFTLRVFLGIVHSPTFPLLQAMWSQWAPMQEKSRLVCCHFVGVPFGSVFIAIVGGKLGHAFGWRSLFSFAAACNLLCAILFFILVRDTPSEHPFISRAEKELIVSNRSKQNNQQKKRPPYLKMFTSMPFIACLIAHTTHLYSMYTFIQLFPKYLGDVQGKSIKDIGFLASMPQALTVFLIIFGSNISDWLHGRGFSWRKIRIGLNCLGSILPAGFCFLYFTVGCNMVAVITFAVITQTLMGFQLPASKANMNDICPLYVAHGVSITNTLASVTGFVSPAIAGELLDTYGNNHKSWGIIWSISGIMLLFGGIFYAIFAAGTVQSWAVEKNDSEEKKKLKS